jgi:hypothetical protein
MTSVAWRSFSRTRRDPREAATSEGEVARVKIGALCWNQYTDWPSLLQAGIRADRLGYDSLWT